MVIFSIVPIEVWRDKRLTLEQIRVLGAILSFRAKDTNIVWPRRSEIAERSGMHPSNISTATSALVKLGWLEKDGRGGHSKATRYTIRVPDTVAHSATVAEQATVAQSATPTVAQSATRMRVAHSATRKEDTNEQTNRRDKVNTRAKFDAVAYLSGKGVDAEVVADWLALRKEKRAPATLTVIAGNEHEAVKAGITLADALRIACMRGWASFNADWHANSSTSSKRIPRTEDFANRDYTKGVNPDGTF